MPRPAANRHTRMVTVAVLVAVAVAAIVAEPFPKGLVLLSITKKHGIDAGDLPAIILLLVAALLAVAEWFRRRSHEADRQRRR